MNVSYLAFLFKSATDAPKSAPFGEWIWPSKREGIEAEEKENVLEKQLWKAFRKHFQHKPGGLNKKERDLVQKILKSGHYSEVFHAPPQEKLYRGLKFKTKNELAKFLNIDENKLKDEGQIEDFNDSFQIKDKYSSSWSSQKKITKEFSHAGKYGYAVTLIANTGDNPYKFVAGPGGLYDVEGLTYYHLEKETVGLEPIIVNKIEWEKI